VKLGTLLLRDGVISLSQLEAGLRAQVLYGGRLGTNLVELDFVDMETLGPYLGRVVGLPLADADMFEAADPDLIRSFDGELAELYTAFPLRHQPDDPDTIAVAIADPTDAGAIEQLGKLSGRGIAPYVAPELRIYYYLEKHYGVQRKARFIRSGSRKHGHEYSDERRTTQPARGIQLPPAVTFSPTKKQNKSPAAVDKPDTRVSYREAGDRIDSAGHRNAIGDALVSYAVGRFETCVVFILRDQNALGWRLYSAVSGADDVETISLPLGGTSALQAAHDSGQPFRGRSPSPAQPVERKLWKALKLAREPDELAVVPVAVRTRVVNIIYVHGFPGEPLAGHLVDELVELARKAGDAYARLIQEAKAAAHADGEG
jgi:hypothetical protein